MSASEEPLKDVTVADPEAENPKFPWRRTSGPNIQAGLPEAE